MNAEKHTPIGATDKLLQTMIRHNYIMKQKDGTTDDGSFDYVLGPRAKVEIGPEGVLSMLKTVRVYPPLLRSLCLPIIGVRHFYARRCGEEGDEEYWG